MHDISTVEFNLSRWGLNFHFTIRDLYIYSSLSTFLFNSRLCAAIASGASQFSVCQGLEILRSDEFRFLRDRYNHVAWLKCGRKYAMLAHAEVGGSGVLRGVFHHRFSVNPCLSDAPPKKTHVSLECQMGITGNNDIRYTEASLDSFTSIPSAISKRDVS